MRVRQDSVSGPISGGTWWITPGRAANCLERPLHHRPIAIARTPRRYARSRSPSPCQDGTFRRDVGVACFHLGGVNEVGLVRIPR